MATPRSNNVKLRLTDLEKADWTAAAGGTRKLSEWIRQVCNAECDSTREPVPNSKPLIVADAIERSVEDQAHRESRSLPATDAGGDDLSSGGRDGAGSAAKAAGPASEQCARWMHHRPGVYCGSCKRVIGK